MPINQPALASNRLLAALSLRDRRRILAGCDAVTPAFGEILAEPGAPIRHVYFPTEGFISQITSVGTNARLEVGMVGDEGMLGISLMLGVRHSPLHAVVQGEGAMLRMSAAFFSRELAQSSMLQLQLRRYLHVLMGQLAQTAACNRFHVVEERLARWLLMTQDRAHSDAFHVTQKFLAYMLGVRRVGVTHAAGALQARDLIRYSRGNLVILDRRNLKAASCACYAADRMTYTQSMGPTRR